MSYLTNPYRYVAPECTFTYAGLDYDFSGDGTVPAFNLVSVELSQDGTKLYIFGNQVSDNYSGYQYTLSTPFDISTASYASISFPFNSQSADIRGSAFRLDNGETMYRISDQTGNKKCFQYTLITGWDMLTMSYASKSMSYTGFATSAKDCWVADSGSKFYCCSNTAIGEFDLGTAYDLASGSYSGDSFSFTSQDSAVRGFYMKADGKKCWMRGDTNDKVYRYSLSTPFEVSSMSYDGTEYDIDISAHGDGGFGMYMLEDETKMYVGDTSTSEIFQWECA